MSRRLFFVFISIVSIFLAACSDNDTSTDTSDSNSTTVTTANGPMTISFSSATAEAGQAISLSYSLDDGRDKSLADRSKPVAGTIHWDDGKDDRLSAQGGTISHTYNQAGIYNIHIQPDGGEKVPVGTVVITAAATAAATVEVQCPTMFRISEKTGSTTGAATYSSYRIELVGRCYSLVETVLTQFALNDAGSVNGDHLTIVIGNEGVFGTGAFAIKEVRTGLFGGIINSIARSIHPTCAAGSGSSTIKSIDGVSTWSFSVTSSCNSGTAQGTVPAITLTRM